jgi:hypothetical protein
MYCRQTSNPVLFETVNQDVYKGVLQRQATAFDVVALSCGQQSSGSSNRTMHDNIRHYLSKNFSQCIKSLCYLMRHIFISQNAAICPKTFSNRIDKHYMRHITQICLSPCDFFLFPRLKRTIDRPTLCCNSGHTDSLTKQPCCGPESAFHDCCKDLQISCKRCAEAGGSYFEGDP